MTLVLSSSEPVARSALLAKAKQVATATKAMKPTKNSKGEDCHHRVLTSRRLSHSRLTRFTGHKNLRTLVIKEESKGLLLLSSMPKYKS